MTVYKDKYQRPIVAITGMGLVTSLGVGLEENWHKLALGCSAIKPITRFNTAECSTKIAGCIDFLPQSTMGAQALTQELSFLAAIEAVSQTGIETSEFGGSLFFAAPPLELSWESRFLLDNTVSDVPSYKNMVENCRNLDYALLATSIDAGSTAQKLSQHLGIETHPIILNTACASGATAIGHAVTAIRGGTCTRAMALGADGSITPESLAKFSLLGALSTKSGKPFSADRDGFVMAEGAGAMVLEDLGCAVQRGAPILAILAGYGDRTDNYHRTRSSPEAIPACQAIKAAINDADALVSDIDYVNAHGTGTIENDKIEYLALRGVFDASLDNIPISSNKSMIGHCLTAAGIIEAVISVLTIKNSLIPPTINCNIPDPELKLNIVSNYARKQMVKHVLSNSFGFGGQNVSLVISRYPAVT